jgi:hypothetical protein
MSRGNGSFIPVTVFLAVLLMVLPVCADNITDDQTTITTVPTTNTTPTATVTTTNTTAPTTVTTVPTTNTTLPTTTATTKTTTTPRKTTTIPTIVNTTAIPTVSGTETETTGNLAVYSSPAGASILIDGIYAGTTPKNVADVPAGNHILRLTLSGFYDYEGSVYVVPGQTAQGYGTLQPMNQVTSGPPATVATAVIPVIVPVITATPVPAQDPGLLGNSTVITAIIGAMAVIIGSAATIFTHIRPPKKE